MDHYPRRNDTRRGPFAGQQEDAKETAQRWAEQKVKKDVERRERDWAARTAQWAEMQKVGRFHSATFLLVLRLRRRAVLFEQFGPG